MNGNNPNRTSLGSSAAAARAPLADAYGGDFHLAELVRTLRSLAGDSPERQAKMEGLMRAYASGQLQVDAEATAAAMIDDAMRPRSRR
ncbi:MAG: flagellar biosynthesis anti-sigma factor FlgM [Acidobacteriota bacterium]|nr:flagellar biosynthesis anti-sigma factor FlgM [Acidobacteriota bacterium]